MLYDKSTTRQCTVAIFSSLGMKYVFPVRRTIFESKIVFNSGLEMGVASRPKPNPTQVIYLNQITQTQFRACFECIAILWIVEQSILKIIFSILTRLYWWWQPFPSPETDSNINHLYNRSVTPFLHLSCPIKSRQSGGESELRNSLPLICSDQRYTVHNIERQSMPWSYMKFLTKNKEFFYLEAKTRKNPKESKYWRRALPVYWALGATPTCCPFVNYIAQKYSEKLFLNIKEFKSSCGLHMRTTCEQKIFFFHFRALATTIMLRLVPPVLPRSFAAVWKTCFKKFSNAAPNSSFRRGHKMSYRKAFKNQKPSNTVRSSVKLEFSTLVRNYLDRRLTSVWFWWLTAMRSWRSGL